MTKVITDDEVLAACAIKFDCYDFDEPITLRYWFHKILLTLIKEGECFDSKRPFGNSGWEYYLGIPFVMSGLLENEDDSEFPDESYPKDRDAAHNLVLRAVNLLMYKGLENFDGL